MKQIYIVKKYSLGGSIAFAGKPSAEMVARTMDADIETVPVIDLDSVFLDQYGEAEGGDDDGL